MFGNILELYLSEILQYTDVNIDIYTDLPPIVIIMKHYGIYVIKDILKESSVL